MMNIESFITGLVTGVTITGVIAFMLGRIDINIALRGPKDSSVNEHLREAQAVLNE